jgi:hypothetical protein
VSYYYDSAAAYKAQVARRQREKAEATAREAAQAASLPDEAAIFKLIRSSNERERIEGYRLHLAFLARKHRFTIYPGQGSANPEQRYIRIPQPINSEWDAAVSYHEVGHVLCGRDSGVLASENAAWERALTLAPFTRPMHDALRLCLWTYELTEPTAPARDKRRLKELSGSVTYMFSRQRWMEWWDRVALVERWQREAELLGARKKTPMQTRWELVRQWQVER